MTIDQEAFADRIGGADLLALRAQLAATALMLRAELDDLKAEIGALQIETVRPAAHAV